MPETKTPAEWAESVFPHPRDRWKHAVAEQLHGWPAHEHHAGEPLKLSEADYRAAIAAAEQGAQPHAAALSPYAPKPEPKPEQPAKQLASDGKPKPEREPQIIDPSDVGSLPPALLEPEIAAPSGKKGGAR